MGRVNSGINFSLEKPSALYLGKRNGAPSAFLPAHLAPNSELSLAGLPVLLPPLACSWGSLQQRTSSGFSLWSVISYELCQEELSTGHRDISSRVLLKP